MQEAVARRPTYAAAWFEVGILFIDLKRYSEAISPLRAYLQLLPTSVQGWINLGTALSRTGQKAEALHAYQRGREEGAAQHLPGSDHLMTTGLQGIGHTQFVLRQYQEAVAAYQQWAEVLPNALDAWMGLGLSCMYAGQFAQAVDAYEHALTLQPELAVAWRNKGDALWNARQGEAAVAAYRQALALDAHDPLTWQHLFGVLVRRRRFKDAWRVLKHRMRQPEAT